MQEELPDFRTRKILQIILSILLVMISGALAILIVALEM